MSSTSVVGLDETTCWQTWYNTCMTACLLVLTRNLSPCMLLHADMVVTGTTGVLC